MIVKNIDLHGYGMMFLSTDLFMDKIKDSKIMVHKFLSYFNKNMNTYFEFIKEGIIVPFNQIVDGDTPLFIESDKDIFFIPDGYKELFKYSDFYIKVGSNGILTLASFNSMDIKDFIKAGLTSYNYSLADGDICQEAVDFELKQGEYSFTMYGLEKIDKSQDETKYDQGYAYGFHFCKVQIFENNNIEKCDDDLYNFGLSRRI